MEWLRACACVRVRVRVRVSVLALVRVRVLVLVDVVRPPIPGLAWPSSQLLATPWLWFCGFCRCRGSLVAGFALYE